MAPKTKKFEDPGAQNVVDLNGDVQTVLKQIVVDMKQGVDTSMMNKWDISWKDLKNCAIKMNGDSVVFEVYEHVGGLRTKTENPFVLEARSKGTLELMDKFLKNVRKEFKERTGKNLTLKNQKKLCNWEMVATNGLYRFFCLLNATVGTALDGQEFENHR